MSKLEHKYNK